MTVAKSSRSRIQEAPLMSEASVVAFITVRMILII